MTIYLDATALAHWSNCREFYRREQIERIEPAKPNTYYHYGKATHLMVESFWRGEAYEKALSIAYDCLNEYPVGMLNPPELETWERMVKGTPDITAAYFNNVEFSPEQLMWIEKEWSIEYDLKQGRGMADSGPVKGSAVKAVVAGNSQESRHVLTMYSDETLDSTVGSNLTPATKVILCGRIDRLMVGPRLVDVKTASEISNQGVPWKQQYRQDKVLDLQFALYDWYLCQQGTPPIEIYLEVLLKPYKSKAARYERIDLNELITESYRKRFRQQLAWKVSEIVHYVENYSQQKPWPLAGGLACSSRYGTCQYQQLCAFGDSEKALAKYKTRIPHLDIMNTTQPQKDK